VCKSVLTAWFSIAEKETAVPITGWADRQTAIYPPRGRPSASKGRETWCVCCIRDLQK
jgi:hypothetical protein